MNTYRVHYQYTDADDSFISSWFQVRTASEQEARANALINPPSSDYKVTDVYMVCGG